MWQPDVTFSRSEEEGQQVPEELSAAFGGWTLRSVDSSPLLSSARYESSNGYWPRFVFHSNVGPHRIQRAEAAVVSRHTAQVYELDAVVLAICAAFLFLNGALDKYPSVQAQTRVARKSVTRGRGGPSYSLIVTPSWRNGRADERLEVSGATFSMVRTGEPVLVIVHRGMFRLPWFSSVLPE